MQKVRGRGISSCKVRMQGGLMEVNVSYESSVIKAKLTSKGHLARSTGHLQVELKRGHAKALHEQKACQRLDGGLAIEPRVVEDVWCTENCLPACLSRAGH